MSSSSSSIKVRFLIDKQQKRVVFAEAGSDFVDILFSFLTLPLGSIVRLLNNQSGLGSLDNLYESAAQLDEEHMQTAACKEMLLNPRSAASEMCKNLKIKYIYDLYPAPLYRRSERDCLHSTICYAYDSHVPWGIRGKLLSEQTSDEEEEEDSQVPWGIGGKLLSGQTSDEEEEEDSQVPWGIRGKLLSEQTSDEEEEEEEEKEGIFVNDTADFIVTDELRVIPSSFAKGLSILKELQIEDSSILEKRVIDFETKEVLSLLGISLISKNALTEFCFPDMLLEASEDFSLSNNDEIITGEAEVENEIILELFLNKRNNKVLCAEVGDNFVNFLFSFLTFPLGYALGFISDNISPFCGCIHNLYSSAKSMSPDYFKSEMCRDMLLTPKISNFYKYKKHILELEEVPSKIEHIETCAQCFPSKMSRLIQHNPKSALGVEDNGRAFVNSSKRFMISDNLHVSPISLISTMCNKIDFPISELVREEVSIDKTKAISLLRGLLVSKKVLTDAFFPKPIGRHRNSENEK